jgi:hypothetical protein
MSQERVKRGDESGELNTSLWFTVGNIVQDPVIEAAVFLNRRLVTGVFMRVKLSHRPVRDLVTPLGN